MSTKDYYQIMGLQKNATDKDIKMAYRRLARKYHPDLNKDPKAEEQFKALGEAYEVLKDPKKRKQYDTYGSQEDLYAKARQREQAHTGWGRGDGAEAHMAEDFFESLFAGGGFGQSRAPAGQDYHSAVHISLEEAYHGAVNELHFEGAPAGKQMLRVKIPIGVKEAQKIRLTGQGGVGRGGIRGDLYLTVHIDKHPLFDLNGNDIYLTVPITPWEAALGATISIPTLGGPVDLKIPAGSQGGQTMRLKKRGMPHTPESGDQYVILKMVTPKPTTEEARASYKKMAEIMPFNPRHSSVWGRGG